MRVGHLRVYLKMIRMKAEEIYAAESDIKDVEDFAASAGWLTDS